MSNLQQILTTIKKLIDSEFNSVFINSNFKKALNTKSKNDNSPVTILDTKVSEIIFNNFSKTSLFNKTNFIDEERKNRTLEFPSFILDPIDGTKELLKGSSDCAVSLAYFSSQKTSDQKNWSWIYFPFIGHEISSFSNTFCEANKYHSLPYLGLVSKSEWGKKYFDDFLKSKNSSLLLKPKGSIAVKLSYLSIGSADFIISFRPKKIWDIAAGTHLCFQKGIHFYEQGKQISKLDKLTFNPPLIWCRKSLKNKIEKAFYIS